MSGLGHAAAVASLALMTYGSGEGSAAASRPLLAASMTEQAPQPEVDRLVLPHRPGQDAAAEAVAWTENTFDLKTALTEPAIGLAGHPVGQFGDGLASPPALDKEFVEKPVERHQKLGRSANFYGIEAEGSKFVFVVDMSGSMSGKRFRRARTELCQTLEHLAPTQTFFVILFNDLPSLMPSLGLAAVSPSNLQLVDAWLKQVECQGGTDPLPALLMALAMKPDAVFLLSDGKFDRELARAVSQLELRDRIPVHTIGFVSRKGEPMLRAISEISGGTYRYVR
jgi:Mg-chelatase subunit ChlD